MGMYTSVRFKGIIKPEYSDGFEDIALNGKWEKSKHDIFKKFGKLERASFIPCGGVVGCCWTGDKGPENYTSKIFNRLYDEDSRFWQFECSVKNQDRIVQSFMQMIPEFVQELYHFEEMYEESEYSTLYELKNGILIPSGKYAWNKFD
jgi:hypothetical protein